MPCPCGVFKLPPLRSSLFAKRDSCLHAVFVWFSNSLRFARPSSQRGTVFCMPCPCGFQTPSATLVPLRKEGQLFCNAVSVRHFRTPSASLVPLNQEGQLICNAVSVRWSFSRSALLPLPPLPPFWAFAHNLFITKKEWRPLVATHIIGILCQLLNKYLFSLDNTVAVNCNNDVYTAYRSWDCCTCRCEVTYRNNLVTLNYEILD